MGEHLKSVLHTVAAASLLVCAVATEARSQLRTVVHATGFSQPVAIVQDPTNPAVQFVVEQGGRIRVVRDGAVLPTDYLDLTTAVSTGGERGLLGLALAPDYAVSERFFVNFTDVSDGGTVVARFRRSADPLIANASSRFDFRWGGGATTIPRPFQNHNGGNLAFGPDGFLYVGLGDSGAGGDPFNLAQNPASLLGKMLRLDVNVPDAHATGYQIPSDNPFVGSSLPGVRSEIWSMGWRNPWRYSFDDVSRGGTGALIVGDVGQAAWEEVDYEPANRGGRNYGWDIREGAHDYDPRTPPAFLPLTEPILEYSHAVGGSITGGFVYRGSALGSAYQGRYFLADFSSGRVWSVALTIDPVTSEATASNLVDHTDELGPAALGNVSSFGIDSDGELFILSYFSGTVLRVLRQPTLNATITGTTITVTVGNSLGNAQDWLALHCPASTADASYADWKYLNGSQTAPATGLTAATVTFQAPSQAGMECDVRLFANNGFTRLARSNPITVAPTLTMVATGGTMTVTLALGPGNARDWIGLFCPATNEDGGYSDFRYLNNSKTPPAAGGVTSATVTFAAPAPGVACNARFFVNNGFTKLATSTTVTIPNPVPTVTTLTPGAVPAGSAAAITVTGTNFMPGSLVHVNDGARATTFVSATELTGAVLAGDVATPGANPLVTVVNPAPGGGTSNSRTLTVAPVATVTPTATTVASAGTMTFTVAGGLGNARDWVGLYCPMTGADGDYHDWKYLNNTRTAPATGVTGATVTMTAPAASTTCHARLFADNGFLKLATSATVSVTGPALTIGPSSVAPGGTLTVTVAGGPGSARDWVGLFCPTTVLDGDYLDWKYLNNTRMAPATGVTAATVTLTAPAAGTTCHARLFADNGFARLATSATATVTGPTVTAGALNLTAGGTITVTVAQGPGNVRDWVGLFCPATNSDGQFTDWKYLNGTRTAPSGGMTAATLTFAAPSTTGPCNLRLFVDESYTLIAASATVTVD